MILRLQWKEHECRHYSSLVHLAHVQAFFYKLESLAGENVILFYLFGEKNNKITSDKKYNPNSYS